MTEPLSSRAPSVPAPPRLSAIDTLRGIVMILMALDHVRDFFGTPGLNPTNLAQTTLPLFFTRWITHLCAPTFFLLTGTGAFLSLSRRTVPELSRFLLTRGLWLIVLELTVIRCLGMQFNVDYHVTMLIVIWALGWAMVALAGLVWLPMPALLAFGVVMIAGHNLLDGIRSANPIWTLLHAQGIAVNRPGFVIFVAYPLIPWIGVTAVGYALGQIYRWEAPRRRRFLLRTGLALVGAFVVLRALNGYGNPVPWAGQASSSMTIVSFLNLTKNPPSLLYLLMTLGPALLILRALDGLPAGAPAKEGGSPRLLAPALTFGRVPLFYFVVHLTLIHLLAVGLSYAQHGEAHWLFESPDLSRYPFTPPPGWGVALPVTYALWVLVVVMLYPLCVWFAGVKLRRRDERWVSYF